MRIYLRNLEQKGLIKPTDRTIPLVLAVEAEKIAGEIRGELNVLDSGNK